MTNISATGDSLKLILSGLLLASLFLAFQSGVAESREVDRGVFTPGSGKLPKGWRAQKINDAKIVNGRFRAKATNGTAIFVYNGVIRDLSLSFQCGFGVAHWGTNCSVEFTFENGKTLTFLHGNKKAEFGRKNVAWLGTKANSRTFKMSTSRTTYNISRVSNPYAAGPNGYNNFKVQFRRKRTDNKPVVMKTKATSQYTQRIKKIRILAHNTTGNRQAWIGDVSYYFERPSYSGSSSIGKMFDAFKKAEKQRKKTNKNIVIIPKKKVHTPTLPANNNRASQRTGKQKCVFVDSRKGWQRYTFNRPVESVWSIKQQWSVDGDNYGAVGPLGHRGAAARALKSNSQSKYIKVYPFGALMISLRARQFYWLAGPGIFQQPVKELQLRINEADKALGNNDGKLKVCFRYK